MKVLALVMLLVFCAVPLASWADAAGSVKQSVADAGNKFCPVSGDKVSGKDFIEHNGKRYGLCCKQCTGKFKKNPEKYLMAMVNQELTGKPVESHDHHMH
ncbi:MAG: YHS domain-containing protein [Candidatus Omnitrophica bacterium]|nr:YHS domain-containing protein [Candidatus Omnitrophota bacterium]